MSDELNVSEAIEPEPDELIEPERYELYAAPAYHFNLDRRTFFKLFGGGIIIGFMLDEALGWQEPGGRQSGESGRPTSNTSLPKEVGAWLKIGEDGTITVYTGKVEFGQDIRTSLSQAVADELRANEQVVPRYHESVPIMFADFEGFSRLTEQIEPKSLIEQLDQFFSAFDAIAERHRLEKLKTIGDAYMCVGGLPEPNRTHDVDTCLAALSMIEFMRRTNLQRDKLHLPRWDLRIGIHSGPVMAGVVGKSKFIYDVWGDAVNIAARLEAAGGTGRINVSDTMHRRVRPLMEFEPRGAVEVKNKAPISMHFLTRIKAEFSRDAEGLRPNEAFHHECERLFPGYRAAA